MAAYTYWAYHRPSGRVVQCECGELKTPSHPHGRDGLGRPITLTTAIARWNLAWPRDGRWFYADTRWACVMQALCDLFKEN